MKEAPIDCNTFSWRENAQYWNVYQLNLQKLDHCLVELSEIHVPVCPNKATR